MSYIPDDIAESHVHFDEDDYSIKFERWLVQTIEKVDKMPKNAERKKLMEEVAEAVYDRLYFYDLDIPSHWRRDYSADNYFMIRLSEIAERGSLPYNSKEVVLDNEHIRNFNLIDAEVQRYKEKSVPSFKERQEKINFIERVNNLENASKYHDHGVRKIKEIAQEWNKFEQNGMLRPTTNLILSGKMMEEIKKDPSLYQFIPDKIKDNPATSVSQPFYQEVRIFIRDNSQFVKNILSAEGDFRKQGLIKLKNDALEDEKLRKDPVKAQRTRDMLQKKRIAEEKKTQKIIKDREPGDILNFSEDR